MVKHWLDKARHVLRAIRDFLDEKTLHSPDAPFSRLQKFAHFWLLVGKSFVRNRCPIRASALAYTTLLAFIPVLFLVVSISSSILRQEGGERVEKFLNRILVSVTPPISTGTNSLHVDSTSTNSGTVPMTESGTNSDNSAASTNLNLSNPTNGLASSTTNAVVNRQEFAQQINHYIQNIQSGTLGVTGVVGLVIVAILMLRSIESTFNDIWGVLKGRSWHAQIMQYSAVLLLGPMLLAVALGLTSGSHLTGAKNFLESAPVVGHLLFSVVPAVFLCLTFAVFYVMMPNTRVHWDAALIGGVVAGLLWHINNYLGVLYVSRWITNSKIYGSLAIIPVFMAGLYFSWLIVLFGAQVAYAWQNRAAYLQEKLIETVNQRGREFVALRLMECIGKRFHRGELPLTVPEMAEGLSIPTRLIQQVMQTLLAAGLVVEVAGADPAYSPARPLEQITCHDILLALRAGQGQDLATREGPTCAGVFGEFEKILAAEQRAASSITLLAVVDRTEHLAALAGKRVKAVTDGKKD